MPVCSAVTCHNQTKNGYRLFRFPSNPEMRKKWAINCRRDLWQPNDNSRMCEVHFEDSQWEQNRADGWRKLRFNAIPTLFSVPNPPPKIKENPRNSIYKILETKTSEVDGLENTTEELLEKYKNLAEEGNSLKSQLLKSAGETETYKIRLRREIDALKKQVELKEQMLSSLLTADQIKSSGQKKMKQRDHETVIKALYPVQPKSIQIDKQCGDARVKEQ